MLLRSLLLMAVLIGTLAPAPLWACACGCGVFEVGTAAMLPTQPGGMAYLEYDFANQNKNRSGASGAPSANNSDKQIRTYFFTAAAQYMFDPAWGVMVELPYWNRRFETAGSHGNITDFNHSAIGDMRLQGVYSGFSPDMSSGLTFGLKLPTGDFRYAHFDRDTEIGTGSTDILLGAYHMGRVAALNGWSWFTNAQLDQPALIAGGYRPGDELDAALGAYYDRWRLGGAKIAPLAQAIGTVRGRDTGTAADFPDTGYDRVLLAPGLEVDAAGLRVNASVGFPIYQYVNGDQLMPSELYKFLVGYAF